MFIIFPASQIRPHNSIGIRHQSSSELRKGNTVGWFILMASVYSASFVVHVQHLDQVLVPAVVILVLPGNMGYEVTAVAVFMEGNQHMVTYL